MGIQQKTTFASMLRRKKGREGHVMSLASYKNVNYWAMQKKKNDLRLPPFLSIFLCPRFTFAD